eukprot:6109779-Pleurochrysis_carterae.AAC.2
MAPQQQQPVLPRNAHERGDEAVWVHTHVPRCLLHVQPAADDKSFLAYLVSVCKMQMRLEITDARQGKVSHGQMTVVHSVGLLLCTSFSHKRTEVH